MATEELQETTQGKPSAEAQLVLQSVLPHVPSLYRFCSSLMRDRADAEDLVQETLLKALTHIDQLRKVECIRGWLLQIAVNDARRRLRTKRRFLSGTGDKDETEGGEEAPDPLLHKIPDPRETPDLAAVRQEQAQAIRRALAKLQLKYREVFVLRDVLGIAGGHAAEILGISEASLHTRLNRARAQMRKMLTPYVRSMPLRWRPLQMMKDMVKMRLTKVVSCRKVKGEMGRYLDGELYGELLRQVEDHIRVCSRCFLILDTTRKTLQLVADEKVLDKCFVCDENWPEVLTRFQEAKA
ncbi:MAG: sigma-70 family RNA polymerase sigma factor [Acidobacteria bacterium]|nr:sigma-70 family RNA polymerase sigma factor [Acidobacteriota bacterium]